MSEQVEGVFKHAWKLSNHRRGDRSSEPECLEMADGPELPPQMRFQQEREVGVVYKTGQPIGQFQELIRLYDEEEYRQSSARYSDSD